MNEVKTGTLWLKSDGEGFKQRLSVTVYRNSSCPFAVFTPDRRLKVLDGAKAAYLALNDCNVQCLGDKSFTFSSKKERIGKGPSWLTFEANTKEERDTWLNLFKCHDVKSSKTTAESCGLLPTIQEYEDNDECNQRMGLGKASLVSV